MTFWDERVETIYMEFNPETLDLSKGKIEKTIAYLHPEYTRSLYEELQNDENFEKAKILETFRKIKNSENSKLLGN